MARPDSADKPPAQPSRRIDLAIGVVLGLVLGIAIVSAFVFLGSEGSVDAPRIPISHGGDMKGLLRSQPDGSGDDVGTL